MGVENNPQKVDDLNSNWPAVGEPAQEGYLHLQNIKRAVKGRANTAGQFGVTTLSSATDSNDEDKAATPKAVNDVRQALAGTAEEIDTKITEFEEAVDDALQNLQFQDSKNQNGYVRLPNGIIMQWGKGQANILVNSSSTRSYINFPIPFPNACLNVVCCMETEANYSHQGIYESNVSVRGLTKTRFEPVNMYTGDRGGTARTVQVFWQAFGY
jgi:hypothetical protein